MPVIAFQWLASACGQWLARRAGLDVPEAPRIPLADSEWELVERMAYFHGIEPLLHDAAPRDAPPLLTDQWERAYYSTRILNAEALDVVSIVLDRVASAAAPVLVVKGPATTAAVYGDFGLRPLTDVDLLCRTRDVPALAAVLRSLGFAPGTPYLHHLDFHRQGMLVELHVSPHDVMAHKRRFLAGAWANRREAALEGWRFTVMSPEHELVFELAHAVHHDFDLALKHAVDFAGRLLVEDAARSTTALTRLLREANLTTPFARMRAAVARLLKIPLPDVAADVDDHAAFVRDFAERSSSFGLVPRNRAAALYAKQRGPARKALFLCRRLIPSPYVLQAAYGAASPAAAIRRLPDYMCRSIRDVRRRKSGSTRDR